MKPIKKGRGPLCSPMEATPLERQLDSLVCLALFTGAKSAKVFGGLGNPIGIQLQYDAVSAFVVRRCWHRRVGDVQD